MFDLLICWCFILFYIVCMKNGLFINWFYCIVRSVYVIWFLFGFFCVCKLFRCNRYFYVINLILKYRLICIINLNEIMEKEEVFMELWWYLRGFYGFFEIEEFELMIVWLDKKKFGELF